MPSSLTSSSSSTSSSSWPLELLRNDHRYETHSIDHAQKHSHTHSYTQNALSNSANALARGSFFKHIKCLSEFKFVLIPDHFKKWFLYILQTRSKRALKRVQRWLTKCVCFVSFRESFFHIYIYKKINKSKKEGITKFVH